MSNPFMGQWTYKHASAQLDIQRLQIKLEQVEIGPVVSEIRVPQSPKLLIWDNFWTSLAHGQPIQGSMGIKTCQFTSGHPDPSNKLEFVEIGPVVSEICVRTDNARTHGRTYGRTDGRTLTILQSPFVSFGTAGDKNQVLKSLEITQ